MAETIKGINVVIGAETTGLSKALGDVNKKSKDIQSELKQVEKLLKLDPTNTELVAQKQKLLTDAVANTQEKLDRLRTAQEQVNEQFTRGDISEGQYRAFQREVAATEQELKRLEGQLVETGKKADQLGERLSTAGDKMKSAGEKMSVGLTAPIAAGGAVMLKGAMDAEAAQGKLQASLGLTTEEAEKLGQIARDVWVDGFGGNIDEANRAVTSVRQNMGEMADQELAKVTKGALTIAQVFDQDVNEVTRTAGVMMKNFSISGQEAMDLITVGFQQGGDFSGELLDTLREYSPQFKSLGLSADQALGMLIAGVKEGAWNLDKVGDAMKEFNIRAQDGSKTTADGFAAIGLDAQKMGQDIAAGGDQAQKAFMATITAIAAMKDPVAQNTAGVALFGTQWEDVRSQVIIAMAEGVKGLDEFKGATERARKAIEEGNPGLALTESMRTMQAAIGPALLPLSNILTNTVAPAIKAIAEGFSNLSPGGQKAVLAIVGIVAAIGPLLVIIGSVIGAFTSIAGVIGPVITAIGILLSGGGIAGLVAAFPVLGTIIGGVGTAFAVLTGPIGLAIAAIAAVIAIGVLLYKNWDTVKEKLSSIWGKISEVAINVWNGIKDFFAKWGETILLIAVGPVGWAVLLVKKIAENWDAIKNTAATVWNSIKEFLKKWGDEILLIAVGPAGWAVLLVRKIAENWDAIKNTATTAWNSIKNTAQTVWEGIKYQIIHPIESAKQIVMGIIDTIKSAFANMRISIPAIKLPHVSVSTRYKKVGSASIPYPDFDVDWYAKGTNFARGGWAVVGEEGPELLKLPRGSQVLPNNQLADAGGFTITGNTFYVRNDQDIKLVARELYNLQQQNARGRGIRQ